MSLQESTDISSDKKGRILQAAKSRFLYYGVSKTTTRDIAEDVGISVSNLYLYFENKREIVLAIANECRAEQDEIDGKVISDDSLTPQQKLERILVEKFRIARAFRTESPKGAELFSYLLQEYPERIAAWNNNLELVIFTVLDEGVRRGDFQIKDTRHAAHMLRIALTLFFLPPNIRLPIEPTEDELITFIRWHLSLVRPLPSGK